MPRPPFLWLALTASLAVTPLTELAAQYREPPMLQPTAPGAVDGHAAVLPSLSIRSVHSAVARDTSGQAKSENTWFSPKGVMIGAAVGAVANLVLVWDSGRGYPRNFAFDSLLFVLFLPIITPPFALAGGLIGGLFE